MKVFSAEYLSDLSARARGNPRRRQHQNIHQSFAGPVQCLFNAIEPGSYIRPHRHLTYPKHELLIAVRGSLALFTFDDQGVATGVVRFGGSKVGGDFSAGVEVTPNVWHTVISLDSGSVLLEFKAGPFDPKQAKDLAHWAPVEGSPAAVAYLSGLFVLLEITP